VSSSFPPLSSGVIIIPLSLSPHPPGFDLLHVSYPKIFTIATRASKAVFPSNIPLPPCERFVLYESSFTPSQLPPSLPALRPLSFRSSPVSRPPTFEKVFVTCIFPMLRTIDASGPDVYVRKGSFPPPQTSSSPSSFPCPYVQDLPFLSSRSCSRPQTDFFSSLAPFACQHHTMTDAYSGPFFIPSLCDVSILLKAWRSPSTYGLPSIRRMRLHFLPSNLFY